LERVLSTGGGVQYRSKSVLDYSGIIHYQFQFDRVPERCPFEFNYMPELGPDTFKLSIYTSRSHVPATPVNIKVNKFNISL